MPDTGTPWNIPYPLSTDPPDDPSQSKTRAEKVAAQLTVVQNAYKAADTSLQSQITALTTRMTAAEAKNTAQDSSIAAINARTADSDRVALAISYVQGQWVAGSYSPVAQRFGDFVYVRFSAIRKGAALTASTTGSMTDNDVCTLSSATFRPCYNGNTFIGYNAGHGAAICEMGADGLVSIICMLPNSVVALNDELRFSAVFIAT